MFNKMGPVHRELEDETDSVDIMSQCESRSGRTTPDHERHTLQSPHSTYSRPGAIEHEGKHHTDAWMGYSSTMWTGQRDIYSSHHSHRHPQNVQQQPQPRQQHLHSMSSSSSWQDTTCMTLSSLENGPTYNKEPIGAESSDDFSQPSSTNQCDSQSRHRKASRPLPTSTHTGLVDLRDLTEPIDMVSGSNCIPLSEKCVKYSLSMEMSDVASGKSMSSLLKRKLPLSLSKSEESSTSTSCSKVSDEAHAEKRRRFTRTTEALKRLGLWEVAIRTGKMIVQNRQLQKDLDQLRQDSKQLMRSVLKNPENDNLKRALVTMQARINAHKHQSFRSCNVSVQS